MGLELITGHRGEQHITSDDAGAFNAGVVGESCVLSYGKKFNEIHTYDDITIEDGDIILQGRHIRLRYGETETFTVGKPRNPSAHRVDLLCIRYSMNEEGIESVELVYKKGPEIETDGVFINPEISIGDIRKLDQVSEFPLYRVKVHVAGIYQVEKLFQVYKTTQELEKEFDENIQTLKDYADNEVDEIKVNLTECVKFMDFASNSRIGSAFALNYAFASAFSSNSTFGSQFASNSSFINTFGRNSAFGNVFASNYAFANNFGRNATFGYAFASNSSFVSAFAFNSTFGIGFANNSHFCTALANNSSFVQKLASALASVMA